MHVYCSVTKMRAWVLEHKGELFGLYLGLQSSYIVLTYTCPQASKIILGLITCAHVTYSLMLSKRRQKSETLNAWCRLDVHMRAKLKGSETAGVIFLFI